MFYKKVISLLLVLSMLSAMFVPGVSVSAADSEKSVLMGTITGDDAAKLDNMLENFATQFVVVKHKQLSGTNNAYTQANTDDKNTGQTQGNAYQFDPGSEMVLLTLNRNEQGDIERYEKVLVESPSGVLRDPDVSADGTTLMFSWKKNTNDDYHLYLLDLTDPNASPKQITFGAGISDTEGRFLPNGKILFSSTRCIQNVDCWIISVANLYTCDYDAESKTVSKITRIGQDQVHTTYPTITSDGRVIYTRWDYNDRTQMYTQPVFQMFPDGTNQTELYGNNTNFPTTLAQTVEIPGVPNKYYSIALGHHTGQVGKLVLLDTTIDRNDAENTKGKPINENNKHAVSFIDKNNGLSEDYWDYNIDEFGGNPVLYKYPIGINDHELLCSVSWTGTGRTRTAPYSINYLYINDDNTVDYVPICEPATIGGQTVGASQTAPIRTSALSENTQTTFERPSMVNYNSDRGTFYVGNVYEGDGAEGIKAPEYDDEGNIVKKGEVDALRVVKLDYRTVSIGDIPQDGRLPDGQTVNGVQNDGGTADLFTPVAVGRGTWDVKQVLGVAKVEDDGSAMFTVPARVPVYFQLLNKDGEVLQTMRSWSTLMPGETFSCVGCHENKNSVPPADSSTTMAMKRGVEDLVPEDWMEEEGDIYEEYDPYADEAIGFSYLKEIQPIFDKSCVSCHNNTQDSYNQIAYSPAVVEEILVDKREVWEYKTSENGEYAKTHAPFGTPEKGTQYGDAINTAVSGEAVWMKTEFEVNSYQLEMYDITAGIMTAGDIEVKVNGESQQIPENFIASKQSYNKIPLTGVKLGKNTIEIKSSKASDVLKLDAQIVAGEPAESGRTLIPVHSGGWKYKVNNVSGTDWQKSDFDDSSWQTNPVGEAFGNNATSPSLTQPNTAITNGREPVAGTKLYVRKKFTLEESDFTNGVFSKILMLNMAYDQNPQVYVNGKLVFTKNAFQDKEYEKIDITKNALSVLKKGENTLAVYVVNTGGGMCFDAGLTVKEQPDEYEIIPTHSGQWKYVVNGGLDSDEWTKPDFDDSEWKVNPSGEAFGNNATSPSLTQPNTTITNGSEPVAGTTLNVRKTFELDESYFKDGVFNKLIYLNMAYDQNPRVYINGELVFTITAFEDDTYAKINITKNARDYLKPGENTLAVYVVNTGGGMCFDAGITVEEGKLSDAPFSLKGDMITGSNIGKRYWPVSYLTLTGATAENQLGNPYNTNPYVMWTSSMSGAIMQPAKSTGSFTSPMIEFLRTDETHKSLLTENEIKRLCAWIDLCVPLCGTYDENANWSSNSWREFEERENKRDFYERIDEYSVAERAGKALPEGELQISYHSSGETVAQTTGSGLVLLEVDKKLAVGDTINVQLPEGEKYLAFTFHPTMKESILYCPTGKFSYTVPAYAKNDFPQFISPGKSTQNISVTVAARIPFDEELEQTRNIALNPFDLDSGAGAYPHSSASTVYNQDSKYRPPRNIVDGFKVNTGGHGDYPHQSWLPEDYSENNWVRVDFGRGVTVEKIRVYLRADFPHDDWFISGNIKFSDGTKQPAKFYKTSDGIDIVLDEPKDTTSIELCDLKNAQGGWASISEFEVYGFESDYEDEFVKTESLEKTEPEKTTLKAGESVDLSKNVSALPSTAQQTFNWSSDNTEVVTVGMDGIVTAVGDGKAVVTASAKDNSGLNVSFEFTVDSEVRVSSVTLSPDKYSTQKIGDTIKINASVLPYAATNKKLEWVSSNTSVATVTDGTVVTTGYGTAEITAKATDGSGVVSNKCVITVTKPDASDPDPVPNPKPSAVNVSGISIKGYKRVTVGKKIKLRASVAPLNASDKNVTWKSLNPKIASVSKDGTVRGRRCGTAKITASAGGKSAVVKITVRSKVTKITFKKKTVSLRRGKRLNLSKLIKSEAPKKAYRIKTKYTWKSSLKKYVTVNSKGVAKVKKNAKKNKKAVIRVYNGNKRIGRITVKIK